MVSSVKVYDLLSQQDEVEHVIVTHDPSAFEAPSPYGPEHYLMLAVLEDAIKIFLHTASKKKYEEARCFLLARDVQDHNGLPWLFSFESICECLNLDPDYLRQGIFKRYYSKIFSIS